MPKSAQGHRSGTRKRTWQERLNTRLGLDQKPTVRKLVYSVVGITVLLIGIAMILLPGPALIVIPIGLAILASEYAWARKIIRRGTVFVGRYRHPKPARSRQ